METTKFILITIQMSTSCAHTCI